MQGAAFDSSTQRFVDTQQMALTDTVSQTLWPHPIRHGLVQGRRGIKEIGIKRSDQDFTPQGGNSDQI
jgi:hypothetical protein